MKNKFDQEMCKDCQQELARRQTLIGENVNDDEGAPWTEADNKLAKIGLCLKFGSKDVKSFEPDCRTEMIEYRKMLMSSYSWNLLLEFNWCLLKWNIITFS